MFVVFVVNGVGVDVFVVAATLLFFDNDKIQQ